MRLPKFFQRRPSNDVASKPKAGSGHTRSAASGSESAAVTARRVQARRCLIGTAILLLIGVIVLSLVLDNTPRPLPADLQVRLAAPASADADASKPVANAASPAPQDDSKAAPQLEGQVVQAAVPEPSSTPPEAPAASTAPATDAPASPPPAKAEGATVGSSKSAAAQAPVAAGAAMGRFVIQLGAFTDEAKIRALRAKVERMGLKTYTQQVGQADARRTRVRIGPFSSRQEAEQTVSKLKAQGLTAAVLTL